jgi:hypothetical protein
MELSPSWVAPQPTYLPTYLPMALQPLWTLATFSSFLILYTDGRTPWTGDQSFARPLPTHRTAQTQNKRTQTSMFRVGFEPTIPVFKRAKSVHALYRAATGSALVQHNMHITRDKHFENVICNPALPWQHVTYTAPMKIKWTVTLKWKVRPRLISNVTSAAQGTRCPTRRENNYEWRNMGRGKSYRRLSWHHNYLTCDPPHW